MGITGFDREERIGKERLILNICTISPFSIYYHKKITLIFIIIFNYIAIITIYMYIFCDIRKLWTVFEINVSFQNALA